MYFDSLRRESPLAKQTPSEPPQSSQFAEPRHSSTMTCRKDGVLKVLI